MFLRVFFNLIVLTGLGYCQEIFKTETITLGKTKIIRIVKTQEENLSFSFNGGEFKSFLVPIPTLAQVNPEKLDEVKPEIKQAVVFLFRRKPSREILPYVRKFLLDENLWVRWDALDVVLKLKDTSPQTIENLKKLFFDPCPEIRLKIVNFFGSLKDGENFRAVYTAILDENEKVKLLALKILEKRVSTTTIVGIAQELINDKSTNVKKECMKILIKNNQMSEKQLCKYLSSKEVEIRRIASEILKDLGTEFAVPYLIKALQDKDEIVKKNVQKALDKIRKKSRVPL